MISGFSEVSLSPKNIYFISGDTRLPQIIQENTESFLGDSIFIDIEALEIGNFEIVERAGVDKS